MTTLMLDRPTTPTAEHNHSCTPQCPNPCPVNAVARPEADVITSPVMTAPPA